MDRPVVASVPAPREELLAANDASIVIDSARRKICAIQAVLDALPASIEMALMQLDANRDSALTALQTLAGFDPAEVQAVISSGVDAVHAAAASKRSGLESELVAADEALSEAIDARAALAEVGYTVQDCWSAPRITQHRSSSYNTAQAAMSPNGDVLVHHAPALSARFAAAEAAVVAIPEQPITSSFLMVEPMAGPEARPAAISDLLGSLALVWVAEVSLAQGA